MDIQVPFLFNLFRYWLKSRKSSDCGEFAAHFHSRFSLALSLRPHWVFSCNRTGTTYNQWPCRKTPINLDLIIVHGERKLNNNEADVRERGIVKLRIVTWLMLIILALSEFWEIPAQSFNKYYNINTFKTGSGLLTIILIGNYSKLQRDYGDVYGHILSLPGQL